MSQLNLWKKRLGSVPDSVWSRINLEVLILADNDLHEISETIGSLKELRQLDLRGNPLKTLPDALASLPSLEKLDLRWVPTLDSAVSIDLLKARGCMVYS